MRKNDTEIADPGPYLAFQKALEKGRFIIQQCKDCGQHVFYPRILCQHCGADDLKWLEASGRGIVYSTSIIRQKPSQGEDYNLVLVDLEEGPRMMSRVVGMAPEKVTIGMVVVAHVGKIDGSPAVLFSKVEREYDEW